MSTAKTQTSLMPLDDVVQRLTRLDGTRRYRLGFPGSVQVCSTNSSGETKIEAILTDDETRQKLVAAEKAALHMA